VVIGSGGTLFGATLLGGGATCSFDGYGPGCGTAYAVTPPSEPGGAASYAILHTFKGPEQGDGAYPMGPLIPGNNGVLYGATFYGGTGSCSQSNVRTGCGAIYSLTPPASPGQPWTEKVLYSFTGHADGFYPIGSMAIDSHGVLYGTTVENSTWNSAGGTVFSFAP
jgi:hypothetical protein